jgi:N-acetylmuramoyl-L-alanine amidase
MKRIVIDAGHGMGNRQLDVYDPGAIGYLDGVKYEEARIALQYALSLNHYLKEYKDKVSVYMTRVDNKLNTPLSFRLSYAKTVNATHFISIHLNGATTNTATGIETLYRYKSSLSFAQDVHEILKRNINLSDRGVKTMSLFVLSSEYKGCLIELGFITNPNDLAVIIQDEVRKKFCKELAEYLANS